MGDGIRMRPTGSEPERMAPAEKGDDTVGRGTPVGGRGAATPEFNFEILNWEFRR